MSVPKVKVIFMSGDKKVGYALLPKKIKNFARGRAKQILKHSPFELVVKYPDGMENTMTCYTQEDARWGIQAFYKEYLQDYAS